MVAADAGNQPEEARMSKQDVAGTMKELGISEQIGGPNRTQIIGVLAAAGVLIGVLAWGLSEDETDRKKPPVKTQEAPVEIVRPTYDEEKIVGAAKSNWKDEFQQDTKGESASVAKQANSAPRPTTPRKPSGITLKKERPSRDLNARESLAMRSMGRKEELNTKEFDSRRKKALSDMKNANEVNSEMMDRMFNRRGKELRLCAQRHNLNGRVSVSFLVSMSGETKNHSVSRPGGGTADPDAVKCIQDIIRRWKFPPQEKETTFRRTLVM